MAERETASPGCFHVHGDAVDVFPAQATSPVRIEFFGDEIDRIRKVIPSTGQTIGELEEVEIWPAREMAFTKKTIECAQRNLYKRAQEDSSVAADLELISAGSQDPSLEKYLRELYGKTCSHSHCK